MAEEHRQLIDIAALKPHPRNYNRHPATQVERIAASLRKFGQVRSIVVWRSTILAGHGVVEAARALGWTEIAADVLPDEYPEHLALAYVAADNELGRLGDPDQAALAAILQESAAADAELLAAIGYSQSELDRLLFEIEITTINASDGSNGREGIGKDLDKQIRAVLYTSSVATFESAIKATGKRNRGEAIVEICRFYLEGRDGAETKGQLDANLESSFEAQFAS